MASPYGSWIWRKSSFSESNGNSDCVEVGHWRKSTFSQGNGNSACVEVGFTPDRTAVRDSKNPEGGMLTLPEPAWHTFRTTLTP